MQEQEIPGTYRDPDNFDIAGSLRAIRDAASHHVTLVLVTCSLTVALVAAYTFLWPAVYSATATLMVERDTDPVRDSFYLGWDVFRKDDARTEIELMTAGPLLKEVIEKNHLGYADVYHPFNSHLAHLWETSSIGKSYRGLKKRFLPETEYIRPEDLELARNVVDLRAGVQIDPVAESNVGRVNVKGPRNVASTANTLVELYMKHRGERHHNEAQRSYDILTEQVNLAAEDLKKVEARRLAFSKSNGLVFDLQKENLELSKLTEMEQNLLAAQARISVLEATLRELDRQIAAEPAEVVTATVYEANALRESTKSKRLELETQLIVSRDRYTETSPEVTELKADLAKLDALIAGSSERVEKASTKGINVVHAELLSKRSAAQSDLAGARAALISVQGSATQLRGRMSSVPFMQMTLRDFDREYALAQEKFQQLLSKQAQAAVSVATSDTAMPSMRIIEYAVPPADKSWPKGKILYPGAILLGLVMGVCGALLLDHTSSRLRREQIVSERVYATLGVGTGSGTLHVLPRRLTGTD